MLHALLPRIRLDWVQIEVSSSCNAACSYCPQTAYREVWDKRFFDPAWLDAILPHLNPKTYIHLQGWGEPFLNPDFLTMVETIKGRGFKVGTTTNGTLLTPERMERMVDAGLDLLAFSLAGSSSEENDAIRKGTSLAHVVDCIERIKALKAAKQSPFPKLHIAQMLLRSSLAHLDSYPAFWRGLGVDQVVLSTLSLVARPELQQEARLADSLEEWDELKERLYELRQRNGLQDILHFHLVSPFMLFKRCDEHVDRAAVIGSGGDVTACVMLNLPTTGPVEHWAHGRAATRSLESWGNVRDEPFDAIWRQRAYKRFRKQEELGGAQCATCLKRCVETMETAYQIDPSSMTCRWQLVREANEERAAVRRMEAKLGSS